MFITKSNLHKKVKRYAITVNYNRGIVTITQALHELIQGDEVAFYIKDGKAWICKHWDGFKACIDKRGIATINNKYTTEQLKKIANPLITTVNYKVSPEPTTLQGGVIGYLVEIIK
jgi:hypothetical protein